MMFTRRLSISTCLVWYLVSSIYCQQGIRNHTIQSENVTSNLTTDVIFEVITNPTELEQSQNQKVKLPNGETRTGTLPTSRPPDFILFPKQENQELFWKDHPDFKGIPDLPSKSTNYPKWIIKLMNGETTYTNRKIEIKRKPSLFPDDVPLQHSRNKQFIQRDNLPIIVNQPRNNLPPQSRDLWVAEDHNNRRRVFFPQRIPIQLIQTRFVPAVRIFPVKLPEIRREWRPTDDNTFQNTRRDLSRRDRSFFRPPDRQIAIQPIANNGFERIQNIRNNDPRIPSNGIIILNEERPHSLNSGNGEIHSREKIQPRQNREGSLVLDVRNREPRFRTAPYQKSISLTDRLPWSLLPLIGSQTAPVRRFRRQATHSKPGKFVVPQSKDKSNSNNVMFPADDWQGGSDFSGFNGFPFQRRWSLDRDFKDNLKRRVPVVLATFHRNIQHGGKPNERPSHNSFQQSNQVNSPVPVPGSNKLSQKTQRPKQSKFLFVGAGPWMPNRWSRDDMFTENDNRESMPSDNPFQQTRFNNQNNRFNDGHSNFQSNKKLQFPPNQQFPNKQPKTESNNNQRNNNFAVDSQNLHRNPDVPRWNLTSNNNRQHQVSVPSSLGLLYQNDKSDHWSSPDIHENSRAKAVQPKNIPNKVSLPKSTNFVNKELQHFSTNFIPVKPPTAAADLHPQPVDSKQISSLFPAFPEWILTNTNKTNKTSGLVINNSAKYRSARRKRDLGEYHFHRDGAIHSPHGISFHSRNYFPDDGHNAGYGAGHSYGPSHDTNILGLHNNDIEDLSEEKFPETIKAAFGSVANERKHFFSDLLNWDNAARKRLFGNLHMFDQIHHGHHNQNLNENDKLDREYYNRQQPNKRRPVVPIPRANPRQISYTTRYRYRFGIYPGYSNFRPNTDNHEVYFHYDPRQRRPDAYLPFRYY